MTEQEITQLAYDMGAHPYSVASMVAALKKGIEIGRNELMQESTEELAKLNAEWKGNLDIQKAMLIERACILGMAIADWYTEKKLTEEDYKEIVSTIKEKMEHGFKGE